MTIPSAIFNHLVSMLRHQESRRPGRPYKDKKLRELHKIRNPGWWLVRCACMANMKQGLNYAQLSCIFPFYTHSCIEKWCYTAEKKGLIYRSSKYPRTFFPI